MQEGRIYTELALPAEVLSQIMTGAIIRAVVWWLETPNDYSAEQMAEIFHETYYHGTRDLRAR